MVSTETQGGGPVNWTLHQAGLTEHAEGAGQVPLLCPVALPAAGVGAPVVSALEAAMEHSSTTPQVFLAQVYVDIASAFRPHQICPGSLLGSSTHAQRQLQGGHQGRHCWLPTLLGSALPSWSECQSQLNLRRTVAKVKLGLLM